MWSWMPEPAWAWQAAHLLSSATTVYLVLQVSLPELRNANRII